MRSVAPVHAGLDQHIPDILELLLRVRRGVLVRVVLQARPRGQHTCNVPISASWRRVAAYNRGETRTIPKESEFVGKGGGWRKGG